MALSDQLEELAHKHGAIAYQSRTGEQRYGFTPAGLLNLMAEVEAGVRKQDDALIRHLVEALVDLVEAGEDAWGDERPCVRIGKEEIAAARARLEGNP